MNEDGWMDGYISPHHMGEVRYSTVPQRNATGAPRESSHAARAFDSVTGKGTLKHRTFHFRGCFLSSETRNERFGSVLCFFSVVVKATNETNSGMLGSFGLVWFGLAPSTDGRNTKR
mmetsp:Transcript_20111/g.41329  ORF Transcript_20111/g.41329 Transcript_20111/m.41329 type:complete len:117 (-) Transcript_20111:484-834(-)